MGKPSHYIAVDLGAESGRVMLATLAEGKIDIRQMHRFSNGPIEQDGSLRWDFEKLFGEIKTGLEKTFSLQKEIVSIGVDTWGVDYGLLDKDGKLIENPYHYRDSRTEGMIEYACSVMPQERIYQNTGLQFMPFNTLYQLIACRRSRPELLKKAVHLLFTPNLIMYYLCGNISAEYTIASTSQLMDMKTGQWSDTILETFGLPKNILPKVVMPGGKMGRLKKELADELGGGQVGIVAIGTHDTASAVAAVPADDTSNWAYLSSGTWSLMGLETPGPFINAQTSQLQFTNEGGVENTIRLLKNIMGLWLVQECRRQWVEQGQELDYARLTEMAALAKPFQAHIDPDDSAFFARGQMPQKINDYLKKTGQNEITDQGQMVRVILESLAMRYRQVLQSLEAVSGKTIDVLHIVGGGCQNELLNQLTADATGKKVLAGPVEATVLGNVLVQALASGRINSLQAGRKIIAQSFPLKEFQPQRISEWQTYIEKFSR